MPEALEEFGRKLRVARERKGLTQTALAQMDGTRPANISHIERGAKDLTFKRADRLMKALGVRWGIYVVEPLEPDETEIVC